MPRSINYSPLIATEFVSLQVKLAMMFSSIYLFLQNYSTDFKV